MVLNGREYAFAGGEAHATVSVGGQGIKSYQTLDAQGQLQWSDTDHYTRIENLFIERLQMLQLAG